MLTFSKRMLRNARRTGIGLLAGALCLALVPSLALAHKQEEAPPVTTVTVEALHAGCRVDMDGAAQGVTNAQGTLRDAKVPPGDHYFHVRCPGEPEKSYFVSLPAGGTQVVKTSAPATKALSPLQAAAQRQKLQGLVLKAVSLRARGNFDQAVALLHQAAQLDPKNPDLHRELGITFLIEKDWARARIEMLEAVHHDPTDADAFNGLGYALEKLGDLAQAVKEYHQATKLDPDDASYRRHYLDAQAKLAYQDYVSKKKP